MTQQPLKDAQSLLEMLEVLSNSLAEQNPGVPWDGIKLNIKHCRELIRQADSVEGPKSGKVKLSDKIVRVPASKEVPSRDLEEPTNGSNALEAAEGRFDF